MRQAAPAHGAETYGPSVTRPGGWGRIFLQSGEPRPESSKPRTYLEAGTLVWLRRSGITTKDDRESWYSGDQRDNH